MRELTIKIEILDYWHSGTGRGRGPVLDAEASRTPAGLPYLPGKTVRGLVREGVQQAEDARLVPAGTVLGLFGKADVGGKLRVSDATLGREYEQWILAEGRELAETLFDQISATAINGKTGQVEDQTLRTIEVALPVTLTAVMHVADDHPDASRHLEAGMGFIRGLGTQRRRGLGRARFTLEEEAS
ncbi:MAG: hypothetical protein GF355_04830 [Candidatus Eisenbacteria bacterium]|nr:hypothetical protein [Candidatus Latescibacterota bacterium]MBD3334818.1 hypothetical protein [Candidatus Eisenbacteria bacterium]